MFNPTALIIRAPVVLFSLTIHEFMHGYAAYRAGDPTPRDMGRLTLNPLPHLDFFGTLCLFLAPIGWAKPVIVNPRNFRHPRRDHILVSFAGPGTNIALAILLCLVARFLVAFGSIPQADTAGFVLYQILGLAAFLNFALGFFNLIPLGPLDGHHILRELLPARLREKYLAFNRYGMFIILGLVFFGPGILWTIIYYPMNYLMLAFAGESGKWLLLDFGQSVGPIFSFGK